MFKLRRLEERIVLDGAAIVDAVDQIQDQQAHDELMDQYQAPEVNNVADMDYDLGDMADIGEAEDSGVHVLVISSDITDADDLAAAARDDVVVVRYDASDTSMEGLAGLISEALDGQKADTIAFASHTGGSTDQLNIVSDTVVNAYTMETDPVVQAFWKDVGGLVADGGRIDILACSVTEMYSGEYMIDQIEDLTGVNVAASSDLTGNEAVGGDWVLETDNVDVQGTYFDAERLQEFDSILAFPTVANPIGDVWYDYTNGGQPITTFQIPATTFADLDGDTYANGGLSYYIVYDQNDMTWANITGFGDKLYFQMEADQHNAGYSTDVFLQAYDKDGAPFSNSAMDTFTVYPNQLPILNGVVTDFSVPEYDAEYGETLFTYAPPLIDPDGDTLSYYPIYDQSWITFYNGTFYFNPDDATIPTASTTIQLQAYDQYGGPFSPNAKTITFNVTPTYQNDAPVLDVTTGHVLTTIPEDVSDAANTGDTVADLLLGNTSISDEDLTGAGVEAIAVTSVDDTNGQWQYYNSTYWTAINTGSLGDDNALLLNPTDKVRFVPATDYQGGSSFEFRAWDQTSGTARTYANTSSGVDYGGLRSAFSAQTGETQITVINGPDAPDLNPGSSNSLTPINEDNVTSGGNTVGDIIADGAITDGDVTSGVAPENIAVTQVNETNGQWQYSVGGSWLDIDNTTLSESNALLLESSHYLRFVPNADFNGSSNFTFRAWDGDSTLTPGTQVNTLPAGGTTEFSSDQATATIT